ncbi:MAG: tRNA dihydrouridine synthase DusB [Armatimonadetes bacterium]|nr:tRNA dihydrouridine synthase DusB [Armatimonadota bacterium]
MNRPGEGWRPLRIGGVTVDPPLVLAPMSGVTNLPFRLLCKEQGAGMVCNEFISGYGLFYDNERTREYLVFAAEERPVSSQIFGADPAKLAVAARQVEAAGADILDLNCGCSVPKIVKSGSGASLLQQPEKLFELVRVMVASVSIPVTVKIRLGWDQRNRNAVEVAQGIEAAGAQALAVHGRTATQAYRGEADWEAIAAVKAAVSIPVIGNGDVRGPEDVLRMFATTGCDAVMVGRATQGNPWIFSRTHAWVRTGGLPPEPDAEVRLTTALRHGELMLQYKPPDRAAMEMRKHLAWYAHGLPGAAAFRTAVNQAATWEEMVGLVVSYRKRLLAGPVGSVT